MKIFTSVQKPLSTERLSAPFKNRTDEVKYSCFNIALSDVRKSFKNLIRNVFPNGFNASKFSVIKTVPDIMSEPAPATGLALLLGPTRLPMPDLPPVKTSQLGNLPYLSDADLKELQAIFDASVPGTTPEVETPPLPQSPAPELSDTEQKALQMTFEGILPDSTPESTSAPVLDITSEPASESKLASVPVQPLPEANTATAPSAMTTSATIKNAAPTPAPRGKHTKELIYRANVCARKMLVTDSGDSKKSFKAFSLAFDGLYNTVFMAHYDRFHTEKNSMADAATKAADRAHDVTARMLRDGAEAGNDPVVVRFAQDMLYSKIQITEMANALFNENARLPIETARTQLQEKLPSESVIKVKTSTRKSKK